MSFYELYGQAHNQYAIDLVGNKVSARLGRVLSVLAARCPTLDIDSPDFYFAGIK